MYTIAEKLIFINAIDLGHSLVRLRNDEIVQVNFGDDIDLDAKESNEIVEAIGKLAGGRKMLILNISGVNTSASSAARSHSASEDGCRFTIADAFVTKSLAQKLLGNFYLNFHKPPVPTRIFDDIERAEDWLKSQKK